MELETLIRDFRELSVAWPTIEQEREVYNAAARMLETLAQDITAEHREANGAALLAWENVVRKLGIRL